MKTVALRLRLLRDRLHLLGPPLRPTLAAAAVLLVIWSRIGQWYHARLIEEQRTAVSEMLSLRENALSLAVSRRVALLRGLYAFVQAEPMDEAFGDKFNTFAAQLYAGSQDVNYLALAPGGIIQFIYPPEKADIYLNRDLINDPRPNVRMDVSRAIRLRMSTISTPYTLLDGRTGLVARLAIFQHDDFWGLAAVAIDQSSVLEEAGLSARDETLEFALRASNGEVFLGSPDVFARDPVVRRVQLPDSSWELAAVPRDGWLASVEKTALAFNTAGLAAIALMCGLIYLVFNRHEALQRAAALQERQNLARELHDSVSQAVFGITLSARTARALLDRNPEDAAKPLDYTLALAEAALIEMRALIFELRPESLEKEGLVVALAQQGDVLRVRHELDVITILPEEEPVLHSDVKHHLYRIAQEALQNVVRHASASEVHIRLIPDDGSLSLEIQDNGQGFDTQAHHPGHYGLTNIRERAERLRGACCIDSAPGAGTKIRISIPMW